MIRFTDRLERLEEALRRKGVAGALIASGSNARYFTGFAGEADRQMLLAVTRDGKRLASSAKPSVGQVRREMRTDEFRLVAAPENTGAAVVDTLVDELPVMDRRVLVDGETAGGVFYRIERAFPKASFDLLDPLVTPMRAVKDDVERNALGRAAELTDDVSLAIRRLGADAVGMTERELAVEIRSRLHANGAEGVSFPVVVAAGPNGALPTEYRHGNRVIERGEPVVLDFGGFFDGYASDQTRTVVFEGDPSDTFVEAHGLVREALEAGLDAATPGMTGGRLDAVVREVIDGGGYGDQFVTGTGHGVGLRAHEPPSVAPGSDDELRPGMVFSIEPGIYVEGEFGVRLETLVVLEGDGARALNESPYTWKPA